MTQFTMTPNEVRQAVLDCFQAEVVPFITSSPGMGKSSIIAQIAQDYALELIDLRLSQCAPEDLMGLPMRLGEGEDMKAAFAPFAMFPTIKDEPAKDMKGWILLLDEFNSAPKSVQAAAYKLILDRMVGQAHLHPNVFIVAAGNLQTDRAIVNNLSTAMQSRLVHIQMEVSHKEFMDHAVQAEFDSRVLAFLEFRPGLLHKFDPDHTDRTFPCPRTWEFVSRLVQNKDSDEVNVKLIAGTVGEGAAIEFHTFLDVYKNLPTYRQICDRAETLPVPNGPGSLYATVLMMVDKFTEKSFEDVLPFVERLPAEFRVIYSRGIKRRNPAFIRNPAYIALTRKLVRYLTDDEIPGQDAA